MIAGTRQSARNLVLIEPSTFAFNHETASSNAYQVDAREAGDLINAAALREFRAFRDMLVQAGTHVMTLKGMKTCPDAIFPNWFSTHDNGTAWLYPMLAENRRRERNEQLVSFLRKFYAVRDDFVSEEKANRALEGTGSMVLDRVNNIAYIARSPRTNETLALEWCAKMGFSPVVFDTVDHTGKSVYHTDVILWVGSEVCGVCTGAIVEADRARVLESLARTREVLEFDNAQLRNFCGNAVEIKGADDLPLLVMSDRGYGLLSSEQLSRLNRYYTQVLTPSLPTIETYGGGSARCMVQELF